MHEIERNRSQKLGCQANGGVRAGCAPLDPPMILVSAKTHDCDMHYFANYVLFNKYYFANLYYSVSLVHSKYLFPNLGRSENQTVYNT